MLTQRTKCRNCRRIHTCQEDVPLQCPCGVVLTLRVRRRIRGGGLTTGAMRVLRHALRDDPNACRRCQGTGFRRPAAVERAALIRIARGETWNPPKDCPKCGGKGVRS